jgi:hypothetical protein
MVLKRLIWVALLLAGPTFTATTIVPGTDSVGMGATLGATPGIIDHNDAQPGGTAQTLMEPQPADGGPTTETPEPSAIIMIFSGLALIGLGRVRRGRR